MDVSKNLCQRERKFSLEMSEGYEVCWIKYFFADLSESQY